MWRFGRSYSGQTIITVNCWNFETFWANPLEHFPLIMQGGAIYLRSGNCADTI